MSKAHCATGQEEASVRVCRSRCLLQQSEAARRPHAVTRYRRAATGATRLERMHWSVVWGGGGGATRLVRTHWSECSGTASSSHHRRIDSVDS
eukprot:6187985-Pleurochrysis_carterae.AAC.2